VGTTHGLEDTGFLWAKVEIMLIEATKGGRTSSGGIGNVPIKVESFSRPTPTFSYLGGVFAMKGT
jgi:hypothetical protein